LLQYPMTGQKDQGESRHTQRPAHPRHMGVSGSNDLFIDGSASNGRLSCGEQAYSLLSEYPAILDIATSLSLKKLFGFFLTNRIPKVTCQGQMAWRMMRTNGYWIRSHERILD